ncbi:conserved hypothetical protein [Ricinus communis]|uniref:Uncharacterized protein n=1 Tax=Ricinus communis TaxID=3988 RepID=B9T471_RICCO|nr:conserved hypothetical protein [Ricinus communis]
MQQEVLLKSYLMYCMMGFVFNAFGPAKDAQICWFYLLDEEQGEENLLCIST